MKKNDTHYMRLRKKIEEIFEGLGRLTYRNSVATIVVVLLITGAVCSQLPKMLLDTSALGLLAKDDPIRIEYNKFISQFGNDEIIVIAVKPPEVFDEIFLKKLKSFHHDLEKQVPYAKEINSLINARSTRGKGDLLIVDELFSRWPEKLKDIDAVKKEVMNNPVFINNLISEDGRYTAVIIETEAPASEAVSEKEIINGFQDNASSKDNLAPEQRFLTDKQIHEISVAINHIKDQYQAPDFLIYHTGNPIVTDISNRIVLKDSTIIFCFNILLVCILPLILFRRLSGVLLSNLVMIPAIMTTMGIMAICKAPFTAVTTILPSFFFVVCVGDSIHILSIFYSSLNKGYEREAAIAHALAHSGAAVLMTTLTSAAGIMSFALSDLAPFFDIGIFGCIGVFMAFLYTVILLPALVAVLPVKEKSAGLKQSALIDRLLLSFSKFSINNPKKIVITSLCIGVVSAFYIFQVTVSHFPLSWFPDDMTIRKDTDLIDTTLKGAVPLEVIIDTNTENGIYDPAVLNAIDKS